jgi:hypothetical protein
LIYANKTPSKISRLGTYFQEKTKGVKDGLKLKGFPSRMWRWMIILIGVPQPSFDQRLSISGHYCHKKAEVVEQISEVQPVVESLLLFILLYVCSLTIEHFCIHIFEQIYFRFFAK